MKGTKNKPGYVEVKYRAPGFWPIAISLGKQNLFSYEHSDLEYLRFKNWLPHRPWLCYGYWSVDRRWDRVWYCLVQCLSDAIRLATGMRGPTVPKSNMYQPKASFGPSTIRWYFPDLYSWAKVQLPKVPNSNSAACRWILLWLHLLFAPLAVGGEATAQGGPRMPQRGAPHRGRLGERPTAVRGWRQVCGPCHPRWCHWLVRSGRMAPRQGLGVLPGQAPWFGEAFFFARDWGSPMFSSHCGVPLGSPWGPPWHQVGHVGPRARSPGEGSEEGHLAVQSYGRLLPGPRSALCEARGQRWEPPPVPNAAVDRADPWGLLIHMFYFFPRASERRVLPIVGVCISSSHLHIFSSSHLLIFTSSHLHICSSSHLLIFTSSHLHIFSSSSHIRILTSSHLHIFSSSHLHSSSSHLHIRSSSHLLIFASSHLHIFSSSHLHSSSSHLHIRSSSHLLIFTSSHPHIFTSSHPHIFSSCPLALLPSSSHLIILTSSHLHILTSSHLLLLPSCPLLLFYFSSEGGGRGSANETARNATLSHETRFDRQKLR